MAAKGLQFDEVDQVWNGMSPLQVNHERSKDEFNSEEVICRMAII